MAMIAHQPGMPARPHRSAGAVKKFLRSGDWWRHLLLIIVCIFLFIPMALTVVISTKTISQFNLAPLTVTFPLHWDNYVTAGQFVVHYVFNSIIISGVTCLGVLFVGSLTAYVFARFTFPGKGFLYQAILVLLMIPPILTLVPAFLLVKNLHLLNTWGALILPYMAFGMAFAIFILRTFYEGMPEELFEAARIDGASEFTVFIRIAAPLSKSILGVVAVLNILGTWNNYVWPLVTIQSDNLFPLALGLTAYRQAYYTLWGPLMAGYVIGTIPLIVLFAFTSKLFVDGLSGGALKL
ncbi:MAG TPA: carbohydrate ABC transporter permease [Chloroflexota bacterium]|jgi:multiple sugar transport system permease protein/raffinose/stachyose/melibiose transport system permease protein